MDESGRFAPLLTPARLFGADSRKWILRFYAVSFKERPTAELPKLSELRPSKAVELQGASFTVTDIKTAKVSFSEGELPFVAVAGTEQYSVWLAPKPTAGCG